MLHVERFRISTIYILRMSFSASNNFIIVVTVVVLRVCVPVRIFYCHIHLDLTYVFTAAQKTLYIRNIIVIFAENALFKSYGVICLPRCH